MGKESIMSGLATLGEHIEWKKEIATRPPTKKELRKAGQNLQNAAAAPAPKRPFVFVKPTLRRVELTLQTTEERQASARDLAEFTDEIGPYMAELIGQRRALKDAVEAMGEMERMACQPQVEADTKAINEAIANSLGQNHPGAKTLAVIAYADAVVRDAADHNPDWAAARDILEDLAEKAFLEESTLGTGGTGAVAMGRKTFSLTAAFTKSAEAQEVFGRVGRLIEQAKKSARADFEVKREEVMEMAGPNQLSVTDLKAGKLGFRFLPVPPQAWTDREGKPHRRSAGGLTVRTILSERGPSVVPLAAFGGIERDVARIMEANVYVASKSLEHERIGEVKGLSGQQFNALVGLHRLLRLGIAEAERQEAIANRKAAFRASCDAEREKLLAEVTLTPLELLVGEKPGKTLVEWPGGPFYQKGFNRETRRNEEKPVFFCFALIERDEQRGWIRVADCPERLAGFFAPHREFTDPGLEFAKLGKLGVILRRVRAVVLRGATLEEQKAAAEAKVKAEAAREAAKAEASRKLAAELAAGSGEDISGAQIPEMPVVADKGDDKPPVRKRRARKDRRRK
jgi:hypothetical protein